MRKKNHKPAEAVAFRHLWGTSKREMLATTAEADPAAIYEDLTPSLALRLIFMPADVSAGYFEWPRLPELLPVSFPGVKTSRDEFLIDINREALEKRIARYFDSKISDADLAKAYPSVVRSEGRFNGSKVRAALLARHDEENARAEKLGKEPVRAGKIVRYAYRPFDVRWVYWDPDTKLLDEKRSEFEPHALAGAALIEAREKEVGDIFARGAIAGGMADNFGNGLSTFFPAMLNDGHDALLRPNLRQTVDHWRIGRGLTETDIFYHCVATIHSPAYRTGNDSALRMDWPRVPVPSNTDVMQSSAALGAKVAALLDADRDLPGVSSGSLLEGLSAIALPKGKDFSLTMGWGSAQTNKNGSRIVMPGGGRTVERVWTDAERNALLHLAKRHKLDLDMLLDLIGTKAVDVHINAEAMWEGVPTKVWAYTLGGYQVLKKWLSYREAAVLGRALTGEEALHFAKTARRITEVLCMGPALDAAYAKARECAVPWVDEKPADTNIV